MSLGGCLKEERWMKLLPAPITCMKVKPVRVLVFGLFLEKWTR